MLALCPNLGWRVSLSQLAANRDVGIQAMLAAIADPWQLAGGPDRHVLTTIGRIVMPFTEGLAGLEQPKTAPCVNISQYLGLLSIQLMTSVRCRQPLPMAQ
jgi:hypothetical protein